jgi:hypothetical protein
MNIMIRNITIHSVSDASVVNIGSAGNFIQKQVEETGGQEQEQDAGGMISFPGPQGGPVGLPGSVGPQGGPVGTP